MDKPFEQWYGVIREVLDACGRITKLHGLVLMSDDEDTAVLPVYPVGPDTIFYDECAEDDKENADNVRLESGYLAFPELCGGKSLVKPGEYNHKCFVRAREASIKVCPNDECHRTNGRSAILKHDQDTIIDHMRPRHLQRDRYREVLMAQCRQLLKDNRAVEPADGVQRPDHVSMASVFGIAAKQQAKAILPELAEGSGKLQEEPASSVPSVQGTRFGKEDRDGRIFDGPWPLLLVV